MFTRVITFKDQVLTLIMLLIYVGICALLTFGYHTEELEPDRFAFLMMAVGTLFVILGDRGIVSVVATIGVFGVALIFVPHIAFIFFLVFMVFAFGSLL